MGIKEEVAKKSAAEADVTMEIRVLMAKHDMKWLDIANILGLSPHTIYSKKDAHRWTLQDLIKLSRYFKTSFVIGGKYGV